MEEKEVKVSRVKRKYARSIGHIGGAKTRDVYGSEHFSKMGRTAWDKMTDEQKKQRIAKMVESRKQNRLKKANNTI